MNTHKQVDLRFLSDLICSHKQQLTSFSTKFLLITPSTCMALATALLHWTDGFRSLVTVIPKSFSYCTLSSMLPSNLYSVEYSCPTRMTLHFVNTKVQMPVLGPLQKTVQILLQQRTIIFIQNFTGEFSIVHKHQNHTITDPVWQVIDKNQKQEGPKTELCGTALNTATQSENSNLTLTFIFLSCKNAAIHRPSFTR